MSYSEVSPPLLKVSASMMAVLFTLHLLSVFLLAAVGPLFSAENLVFITPVGERHACCFTYNQWTRYERAVCSHEKGHLQQKQ